MGSVPDHLNAALRIQTDPQLFSSPLDADKLIVEAARSVDEMLIALRHALTLSEDHDLEEARRVLIEHAMTSPILAAVQKALDGLDEALVNGAEKAALLSAPSTRTADDAARHVMFGYAEVIKGTTRAFLWVDPNSLMLPPSFLSPPYHLL